MKKLLGIIVLSLLLSIKAYAHEGTHEPLVCIPESERTEGQKKSAKMSSFMHRLGKLQADCLIIKVEKLEFELIKLRAEASSTAHQHRIYKLILDNKYLTQELNSVEKELRLIKIAYDKLKNQ